MLVVLLEVRLWRRLHVAFLIGLAVGVAALVVVLLIHTGSLLLIEALVIWVPIAAHCHHRVRRVTAVVETMSRVNWHGSIRMVWVMTVWMVHGVHRMVRHTWVCTSRAMSSLAVVGCSRV